MNDNEESMWDDYDYYQNTGELSDYFEDDYEEECDGIDCNEDECTCDGCIKLDLSDPDLINKLDSVIANLKERCAEQKEDNKE